MKKVVYKKENFLPSGSGELPLVYFYSSAAGAAKALKGLLFFCFINGIGYAFAAKSGVIRLKNEILNSKHKDLEKEFKVWKKEWESFDQEFYKIATLDLKNIKKAWQRLDKLSIKLWIESYKIESLDNFSEELENLLKVKLKEKKIKINLLHEIISPAFYTSIQEAIQERKKVLNNKMPLEKYIRKYWFIHGSWAGGELLTEKLLKKDLADNIIETDFNKRKKIQTQVEKLLDKKTINLIKIIRLLTLWREERKIQVQKYCLGYKNIVDSLSKKLSLDRKNIEWLLLKDLDGKLNVKKIAGRKNNSVIVFNSKSGSFVNKDLAKRIIKEFLSVEKNEEIKGIIASKGIARGKVCIVLKTADFHKFFKGDVLVTTMTRPEFFPLLKKAVAIITDEGGLTCHAAIVARELNLPAIIGTKNATKVLKDGDLVEVNANKGFVNLLK